jgi:hypothetical protein
MTEYIVIEEQVVYAVTTETSIDVVVQPQTTQLTVTARRARACYQRA